MNTHPLYNAASCHLSYRLYWTLSLFGKNWDLSADPWLENLKRTTEKDGVRILEYRLVNTSTNQFLLSTRPEISPGNAIRSVKGRLQYLVRQQNPRAFKANYSIKRVGSAKYDQVEHYLDDQLLHHRMADPTVQEIIAAYQIDDFSVDLKKVRRSAHGEYLYNLHLVLVHTERDREIRKNRLAKTNEGIRHIAQKKGHLLFKARILSDHIHLMLGCDVKESPVDVGMGYLNNLAFIHGQTLVFESGFYVGTFGEYDLGAIRKAFF